MMHDNNNDVEYGDDDNVVVVDVPMETSAEFSEDPSGARVMRGGDINQDVARTAFVRLRRWRKVILTLTVLLATTVVIAFVMGRQSVIDSPAYQEGLAESSRRGSKYWKLVGDQALTQPDFVSAMGKHEYVNFGYKVKIDKDGNRLAIVKQGVNKDLGGAVEVFTHYDFSIKDSPVYHPEQWFHDTTLKIPPANNGDSVEHPHQAVDMAEDGHRIVFNQGNQIHVYFVDGPYDSSWDPLGSPLELPSNHDAATTVFGHEVAMSGDGFTVAVLGYSTDNREKAFVDIFHYKSIRRGNEFIDQWTMVKEFQLQSDKGGTMAMDTLGKRLVVGETASGAKAARISVFDRLSNEDVTLWKQHEDAMTTDDKLAGKLGSVVSLSGDGMRLAFGSENGQGEFFHVLQSQTDGDDVKWIPLGKAHQSPAQHMRFGASLDMSLDGKRLAVGAPGTPELDPYKDPSLEPSRHGRIYLYQYDEEIGEWLEALSPQRSSEPHDSMGISVSIDEYGTVVAAGAPRRFHFANQSSGAALVYEVRTAH